MILINSQPNLHHEQSQLEMNKLHDLANQTEQQLQIAMQSNLERNEQLNILLERSDLLLHKNQAFGIGVMDYRKDFERKQSMNNFKYIAIGILLLLIVILVVILNVVLNHSNRNTNLILE